MYSMTPTFFGSFVTYEYSKFAEFYADFKSNNRKTIHSEKKLFAKNFCKLVVLKRRISDFSHFFGCNFFVSKFFTFFSTISKSA